MRPPRPHVRAWLEGDEPTPDRRPAVPAITVDAEPWSEADIPLRPWLAKGYLLRGAVTVVSGPGSAGKSSLMIAWCIALALERQYGKFHPVSPMTILTYNVEDDAIEQKRRLSATLRQFSAVPEDLCNRVVRIAPTEIGTVFERDEFTGRLKPTAAMTQLQAEIIQRKPDVVILDPLVELHDAEENDNTAIRAVLAQFRRLAELHSVAVVLLHHTRKGSAASPGDPDTIRGASAIVGAARIVLTLSTMTADEAATFSIPDTHRSAYFRLDSAKSNYAPLHEAEWFERVPYDLDNGESVAAAVPWQPPSRALTADVLDLLVNLVEAGTPDALPWSERISDSEARSFARGLDAMQIIGRHAQKEAIRQLLASGRVVVALWIRPGKGKKDASRGLRSSAGMPDCVEWAS